MTSATIWTEEMIRQAVRLREGGFGCEKIGRHLGVGKTTVAKYMKSHAGLFRPTDRAVKRVHHVGGNRWVESVKHTTVSGEVVSLPRVSILNGKEG